MFLKSIFNVSSSSRMWWALNQREKKLLKKIIPREFTARPVRLPSGEEFSIGELVKRDRVSTEELKAMMECLPKDVELHKFFGSLRPRQKGKSEEEMTGEERRAKEEYRQRIQRLKDQQANREYAKMTENIDPSRTRPILENFGQEMREVNRQIVAVFNTLITVGGAFAFGFWGIGMAYPSMRLDIAERMLMGLVFATIVFFADLYFILRSLDREEGDGKVEKAK